MNWLLNNYLEILAAATALVAAATVITNLTPNKRDDEIVGYVRKALQFVSLRLTK